MNQTSQIDVFNPLYTRFLRATAAMARARAESSRNPWIVAEEKRFAQEIVAPMEEAWARVPVAEKEAFWVREHAAERVRRRAAGK